MQYIPIDNKSSNYAMNIEFDSELYTLGFRYNTRAERWTFSLRKKDEEYIFNGLFLVLGVDYFAVVEHDDMPSGILTMVNLSGTSEPDFDNFGTACKMVYING